MNRLKQGCHSNPFILKVPKTISIILWLKIAPQPWDDSKLIWIRNKQRHMDLFYSSDILLKHVLTVGISERQRCVSMGVGRSSLSDCWMIERFPVLIPHLKNMMASHTNTKTSTDFLLPPSLQHLCNHLLSHHLSYDLSLKNMDTVSCTVYTCW